MIYLAIPSITPRLAECAVEAIARTTPEPHHVMLDMGPGTHGEKLDRMFATLPADADYFLTMDDDAAPLKIGWLTWMLEKIGDLDYMSFGYNMAVGCLYRAAHLRRSHHTFAETQNPGDAFGGSVGWTWGRDFGPPPHWWLRNCEVYRDDHDDLLFAHLGGGTIGHTWRYQGKLYPRIPTWLWPIMVRRYLNRTLRPERGSRLWHEEEHRP